MNEHLTSIASQYRDDARRLEPKVIFFAGLLFFSHLLEIETSDVQVLGLKLKVEDVSVLRGGIALVFWHYFFNWIQCNIYGQNLLTLKTETAILRNLVKEAKKPFRESPKSRARYRTPKEVRSHVRSKLIWQGILFTPWIIVVVFLLLFALIAGSVDIFILGGRVFEAFIVFAETYL